MSRNILELKSIKIAPEKVQTLAAAKRLAKLKDFVLKEEYFETVYHPADLVKDIAYYVEGETYHANIPVVDIKGTLHPSYYDNNWLVMMMNLDRHKNDFDVENVKKAILNTSCIEPIHLSKYGDLYFINGGGNHRVCQAKFLGIENCTMRSDRVCVSGNCECGNFGKIECSGFRNSSTSFSVTLMQQYS